jgi:hypothetical protein
VNRTFQLSAAGCTLSITDTRNKRRSDFGSGNQVNESEWFEINHLSGDVAEVWKTTIPLDRVDPGHISIKEGDHDTAVLVIPTIGKDIHTEVSQMNNTPDKGMPYTITTEPWSGEDWLPVPSGELAGRLVNAFADAAKSCGAKASKY